MLHDIAYRLFGGKNSKFLFFAGGTLSMLVPSAPFRARRGKLLAEIASHPEREDIEKRAAYYCKLGPASGRLPPEGSALPDGVSVLSRIGDYRFPDKKRAYFFDLRRWLRYFPKDRLFAARPGDAIKVPAVPALLKSRPIACDNANSVLLKLNSIRHFIYVDNDIPFGQKDDTAIFRGKIRLKPKRLDLFEKHFGAPGLDLGATWQEGLERPEWVAPLMSLKGQLRHKFILCIEGTEVSSNLKWVMSSNSVAVMPRPEFETWFLEGWLVPGVHYIEIAPDYSDLQEKLAWYRARPEECEKIVQAAHAHVARFRDDRRERLVSLLTLDRYFKAVGE